ncbi:conserved hypothetical integral membrane protein [Photorhabdus khanii NC19]|uniref:Probable queuosine precursor transporter n=1 Tax=Photorhabdus khanii NC19 TaxID=1004151 RepID=W3VDU7_9GAMM|nr:queuosine precursor transporter [Photorhabdus khanii]ETS33234.1 conserved hypothetical integral membrane protein [Photorhabdus khanii NC19]
MRKFKLMGFKRGKCIKAIILVTTTGKTFTSPLDKIVESDIIENLSHRENKEIYRKLYSSGTTKSYYEFEERNERNWFSYIYLCIFLSVLYLSSNIIGIKPAHVFGLTVPAAIFIYPLTYIISDILNEFYGLRFARKAINSAFLNNLTFCFLLYLSTKIPALDNWEFSSSFNSIVFDMIGVLFASSVSYIVSEHTNAYLLYRLKLLTKARFLPFRVITSTIISSFVDSFIFINLAFHHLEQHMIWSMIGGQLLIKLIYAIIGIVPIYIFRYLFNKFIYQK